MNPKTFSTIEKALRADSSLEFNITYRPTANVFRGCCGAWCEDATVFQEDITVHGSNLGGVLEQLAREMLAKYLTTELPDGLLSNDKS